MSRILIVCGAGAASTFLAARIRSIAAERGLALETVALSESLVDSSVRPGDSVLVGPHLHARFDGIREVAESHGGWAVLLSHDAYRADQAASVLDRVLAATPVAEIEGEPRG